MQCDMGCMVAMRSVSKTQENLFKSQITTSPSISLFVYLQAILTKLLAHYLPPKLQLCQSSSFFKGRRFHFELERTVNACRIGLHKDFLHHSIFNPESVSFASVSAKYGLAVKCQFQCRCESCGRICEEADLSYGLVIYQGGFMAGMQQYHDQLTEDLDSGSREEAQAFMTKASLTETTKTWPAEARDGEAI